MKSVRVVIVDDSAVFRQTLPDVIVLDLETPGMEYLTSLGAITARRPIPAVCSTLSEKGSEAASSLVFGVPGEAARVLPVEGIATGVLGACQ